ncbi:MAG: prolyl oligopeptidase family serine peptidase, partial [Candidatus Obscuribacterales bacterium]|nr:prolyl oligopeptidase family serine peptidase [Candidatus Obscuribacterales bacterium]
DWVEIHVRDIASGKDLPDIIRWVKFSGASWSQDGKGFYYGRFDAPPDGDEMKGSNFFQKLYFHKLGTSQDEDQLIVKDDEHKEWGFGGGETEDGAYLIISVSSGTARKNQFWYRDLGKAGGDFVKLVDNFENSWDLLCNEGPVFWLVTDHNAPKKRVVKVDLSKCRTGEPLPLEEVIAQADETLEDISFVGGRFFAQYLKDVCSEIRQYDQNGKFLGNVQLPGLGSAGGFGGKRDDKATYYSFSSYTMPPTTFKYDLESGQSSVHFQPKIDMDPSKYVTKRVFYTSKDGTQVPMFISYRKGLKRNGNNPCYLYGYGGFSVSGGPGFSASRIVWMDMGCIFVEACIRGGGEYGEEWHEAGTKLKKQNVFDDFIAAAEWLIDSKYTSSKRLAIGGGSNGGLLVGACMTQRPELFGAAIPEVGVLDMLRFHLFTIGHAWISDYGCSSDPAQFKALLAYSPYHNLKPGTAYPATLVLTGDHDDRVVPAHSFKFAAMLQACHKGEAPVLIRISKNTGHGSGKPLSKAIEEIADKWGFLIRIFGISKSKLKRLS